MNFIKRFYKHILISLTALILGYGVLRLIAYKYVQPDEIGIWMTNGGYNGMSDYQVWHGSFPFDFTPATKSFILPGNPWTIDLPASTVLSKQNGKWEVDPSYTFSVNRELAPKVCHKYNSYLSEGKDSFLQDVGDHFLTKIVTNTYVELLGTNKDTFMMNDKMLIAQMIEDSVRVRFLRLGFNLENFVTGITPPKSILDTKEAENKATQAVFTAKAQTIEANATAAVKLATANADAEAMLVGARAAAEALRLQQQQLSPLMIQKLWIDRWDGALPYMQTGSNTSMLMQMPKQ